MKARLPKGYGGGGSNNIQQLARQAQKLQDDMEAATAELEAVEIQPEVVDPDDVEMLGDLVMAAANEALRAAAQEKEEKMDSLSGGLNIPGMF